MDRQRPRRTEGPSVAFVGAGRAGRALALGLAAAGHRVIAIDSRSRASAESLIALLPDAQVGSPLGADLVLLTVPDAAIADVAARYPWRLGQFVVHCAGSLGREALVAAETQGAMTGAWHPLVSFAGAVGVENEIKVGSVGDTPTPLGRGSAPAPRLRFAIEAPPPLDALLAGLTEDLGGVPLVIPPDGRAIYHLGATLVSNYAVSLVALAAELWETLGIDRATATAALAPLLAGTASNLANVGLPDALTGPIARGDVATIDRHLAALDGNDDVTQIYQALGTAALRLAVERGLSEERATALAQRFESPATAAVAGIAGGSR